MTSAKLFAVRQNPLHFSPICLIIISLLFPVVPLQCHSILM
jgi:hypothetical protein